MRARNLHRGVSAKDSSMLPLLKRLFGQDGVCSGTLLKLDNPNAKSKIASHGTITMPILHTCWEWCLHIRKLLIRHLGEIK